MSFFFKNILFWLLFLWGFLFLSVSANPPTFEQNFVKGVMNSNNPTSYGNESLWDWSQLWLDKNKTIMENIKIMFYPDYTWQWGRVWDIVKVLGLILFVWALLVQWFMYLIDSDNEDKVKGYHVNLAYIFLGGIIFFATTWILWIWLSVWWNWWTAWLLERLDRSILFQLFSGIRAGAFFTAIVLLWYYGWSMMSAMDDEEKVKKMRQWVINIIIVLVVIKLIDYIYFVAQSPEFKSKATELVVEVSKVIWYILWGFFTLSLIYYWFRLMFSGGDEEALTKVKNIITSILLVTVVIFIFFLIVYQLVQEFSW